ncbi:MAG: energy transducer TonB [Ignavibacteriales bacterium]|nr:energy transducer TonB [Ignavibacteriales bacterium]
MMNDIFAATFSGPLYGRFELREIYRKYLIKAFAIASVIQFVAIGTYYGVLFIQEETEDPKTPMVRILKYSELGPPPSLTNTAPLPTVGISSTAIKPSIGIPVPVPDAQVNPDQTFATQQELSAVQSPASEQTGEGGGVSVEFQIDDPGIDEFLPVEKEPQVVKSVSPKYPEVARLAGIEGTVWLKILVGKDGKPKRVVVLKEVPKGMFSEAAMEAAMQFLFTPAIMNAGPVACWVAVPFRFTIKSQAS